MKKSIVFLAVLCAVLLGIWLLWSFRVTSNQEDASADEHEIAQMVERIPIGATPDQVLNIFGSTQRSRLNLQQVNSDTWLITTPMRFGATNWDLWISFYEGKVQSLKVRLADSKTMQPPAAPPDKT